MGESTKVRIVPVIIDEATLDWAAAQPSIYGDGKQPIGVPGPDNRFREVFGLLSDKLAVGGSLTTMYAYSLGVDLTMTGKSGISVLRPWL